MQRPNPSKPGSRNPADFEAAGYARSSATSLAYKGQIPELDLSTCTGISKWRLALLILDPDPEVALGAIKLNFNFNRLGIKEVDETFSAEDQAELQGIANLVERKREVPVGSGYVHHVGELTEYDDDVSGDQ